MGQLQISFLNKFEDSQILEFLRLYPFRRFYIDQYRISSEILAQFHLKRLRIELSNKTFFNYVLHIDKQIFCIIGLKLQPGYSNVLGFPCYDLGVFYNFIDSQLTNAVVNELVKEFICKKNVGYITAHPDSLDVDSIDFFQKKMDFNYIGSSLRIKTTINHDKLLNREKDQSFSIREGNKEDIQSLMRISSLHDNNQIFYDKNISKIQAQQIFESWMFNHLINKSTSTLIVTDNNSKEIIGFITWTKPKLFNDIFEKEILTADFIVVKDDYQNKGIAKELILSMMEIETVTTFEGRQMSNNYKSIKLLQSFNGIIASSDIWLSKKIDYVKQ